MATIRRLFRFPWRTAQDIAADVDEEIRFHLDMRSQELVDRGWSPDAARREAARQFGDLRATARRLRAMDREKERTMRFRTLLDDLRQDGRYAWRGLRTHWPVTLVALVTIALGIGSATAVFSIVHAVLLRPLPFRDPDRLVVSRLSVPDHRDLSGAGGFESLGIWASNLYNVGPAAETEQVLGAVVSREVLSILGVPPAMGRIFAPSDGDAPLVVLGYAFWQRRLGGDPTVIGRSVSLSGTAHTVVGVMPPAFSFPSRDFELWVNFESAMRVAPEQAENRGLRIFRSLGRLRPGLQLAQVQAEADTVAARLARQYPDTNGGIRFEFVPLHEHQVGDVRTALLLVLTAVGGLLLLACANVANLLLARTTVRGHEIAIRAALGAGRARLVRQLLTESLALAFLGGVLGFALASAAIAAAPAALETRVPRAQEIRLDLAVLAFSMLATVAVGVLFGMAPAAHLSATPAAALGDISRGATEGRRGVRLRGGLVVVQVAVAVLVLSVAGLLARSLDRLLRVDAGFQPRDVVTFNVALFQLGDGTRRAEAAQQLLASLQAMPGIVVAGGASALPPVTAQRSTRYEVAGLPADDPAGRSAYFIAASADYFRALGTPLLRGRFFAAGDSPRAAPVVILSRSLAERVFPDRDPIGQRLRLVNPEQSADWRTVVGVVADIRYQGLADERPEAIYTPFAQTPFLWMYGMVRTAGDGAAAARLVREAAARASPPLMVARIAPMTALVSESVADPRFHTLLLGSFAGLALLLSAVGLYGVVSYSVTRRKREMGIRLALGARPARLLAQILAEGVVLTLPGIVVGIGGSMLVGRLVWSLLYEIRPSDPVTLGGASMVLLAVAIVASLVPARRAARVDAVVALHVE